MDNKRIFDICLVLSLFGLFAFLLLMETFELKETLIKDIKIDMIDERVKISGLIDNIIETKGLYILKIKDNSSEIDVLIFKKENITLIKNSFVCVEGSVAEYEDKTEIIAKRVTLK